MLKHVNFDLFNYSLTAMEHACSLGYNKLEYKWAFNVPGCKTNIHQNNDADNTSCRMRYI